MADSAKRDLSPLDALVSPRFTQPATYARLPWTQDLAGVGAAFVGVPFDDATTFRTGARQGPASVREQSRLLRPYNMVLDVEPFETLGVIDFGDVNVIPGHIPDTFARVEETLAGLLGASVVPFLCGGDHSITLPALRSLARVHGPIRLIHFDSHFDFWDQYWGKKYTHGTWLRRALDEGIVGPVAQVGIRGPQFAKDDLRFPAEHGILSVDVRQVHGRGIADVMRQVLAHVGGPVYLSVDIDVVDPAFAPGTGTPEVGGLTSFDMLEAVRACAGASLVGMDVVEVSPVFDGPGQITALLAANLLYEGLSVLAAARRAGGSPP